LNPEFVSNFGQRVMANVVSEEENVKAVVAKVVLGEADAGIVYRSDVTEETNEHVRVFPLPPSVQVVAEYPIALVRGAPAIEAAHAFLKLLGSRTGRAVLERHRLDPVAPDTRRKANPR